LTAKTSPDWIEVARETVAVEPWPMLWPLVQSILQSWQMKLCFAGCILLLLAKVPFYIENVEGYLKVSWDNALNKSVRRIEIVMVLTALAA
jgi:hypothetical protein